MTEQLDYEDTEFNLSPRNLSQVREKCGEGAAGDGGWGWSLDFEDTERNFEVRKFESR